MGWWWAVLPYREQDIFFSSPSLSLVASLPSPSLSLSVSLSAPASIPPCSSSHTSFTFYPQHCTSFAVSPKNAGVASFCFILRRNTHSRRGAFTQSDPDKRRSYVFFLVYAQVPAIVQGLGEFSVAFFAGYIALQH